MDSRFRGNGSEMIGVGCVRPQRPSDEDINLSPYQKDSVASFRGSHWRRDRDGSAPVMAGINPNGSAPTSESHEIPVAKLRYDRVDFLARPPRIPAERRGGDRGDLAQVA